MPFNIPNNQFANKSILFPSNFLGEIFKDFGGFSCSLFIVLL